MPNVDIRHEADHYAAYVNGEFYCSADTYFEAVQELVTDGILKRRKTYEYDRLGREGNRDRLCKGTSR